ncbi:hypothetical protein TNCV_1054941 [Trichonephila clavipes]|nr:hypothetical protein TNCV_1054941 [Trichonephila clavipes]
MVYEFQLFHTSSKHEVLLTVLAEIGLLKMTILPQYVIWDSDCLRFRATHAGSLLFIPVGKLSLPSTVVLARHHIPAFLVCLLTADTSTSCTPQINGCFRHRATSAPHSNNHTFI